MRLVVGALDRGIELELHGAHLAAVIDVVEVLAEPVEALGGIDARAQAEEGDGRLVAFGDQIQREPALPVEARAQYRAGALFVIQGDLHGAGVGAPDRRPEDGEEAQSGWAHDQRLPDDDRVRIVVLAIVEGIDSSELQCVDRQAQQHVAVPKQ